jgi:hypothetical protein
VRLRELGIAAVYKLSTGQGGSVIMGTDAYSGFEWDGPAVDAWLDELLTSDRGAKKSAKLGRANAPERHLVIVLDPSASRGLRLLVGGSRADWDTVCVETAGVVSMASMCHRSGRTQDDLESRKLPAARCAVAVPSILLEDLRGLGMKARPR